MGSNGSFSSGKLNKWTNIIYKILYKYVPQPLIDRPKTGFGIPIGKWLRGPLKEWAEDYLSPSLIERQGYLNSELVTKLWKEHISMKCDHSGKLWSVLMWQSWQSHHKVK